jgi:hypothetical protein
MASKTNIHEATYDANPVLDIEEILHSKLGVDLGGISSHGPSKNGW